MEMKGECRIKASREQVWAALNDPEILKAAITGCETLEADAENHFVATVTIKVGPVKAKFSGEVTLSDIDPPNGYTISGQGKGGPAGFAKGGAKVALREEGGETVLSYEVEANVGGKLAQLGSRLIDGTARKLADEFFKKFAELAAAPAVAAPEPEPEPELEPAPELVAAAVDEKPVEVEEARGGLPTWVWAGGLIVIVLIVLYVLG